VADLKGKKVGVARGGAQELVLLAELGKHKLTYATSRQGRAAYLLGLCRPESGVNGKKHRRHVPVGTAVFAGDQQGFGVEIIKPYDTPIGEPVRTLLMTEELYNKKRDVPSAS